MSDGVVRQRLPARSGMASGLVESAARSPAGRGLWVRWTLATALGELLGFAVPATAGAAAFALGVSDPALVAVAVAAGAAEGAVLGGAQSLVLRAELARFSPRRWILATAAAATVAWAAGMSVGVFQERLADRGAWLLALAAALAGALILTSIGLAQWLVLREHAARAWRWIPANVLAWSLGLALVLAGTSLVGEDDPAALAAAIGIASGLAMGLTVAAVTGLALVRILRPRRLRPFRRLANAVVRALLRSPLHGLLDGSLVVLSYTGRRSGRRRTLPVMYARDEGRLLVVAGRPERKRWWRSFLEPAPVDVLLQGRNLHCVGSLIEDPRDAQRALAAYLRRFPRAARSLGVELQPDGAPDRDSLARVAETAVIVALEPEAR